MLYAAIAKTGTVVGILVGCECFLYPGAADGLSGRAWAVQVALLSMPRGDSV